MSARCEGLDTPLPGALNQDSCLARARSVLGHCGAGTRDTRLAGALPYRSPTSGTSRTECRFLAPKDSQRLLLRPGYVSAEPTDALGVCCNAGVKRSLAGCDIYAHPRVDNLTLLAR